MWRLLLVTVWLIVTLAGTGVGDVTSEILDTLRYTPRSEWTVTLSCHFGARFFVIDTDTRRVVAACPSVFTNARADVVRLRTGTLWESVTERKVVELRDGREWKRFRVETVRDERLRVLVVILRSD